MQLKRRDLKSPPQMSSVKKGKLKSNTSNVDKSHVLPYKPRKTMEGSLNGRFEAGMPSSNINK